MSKLVTSAKMYGETENGALTYVTSGSKVLDLFSQGGALRKRSEADIIKMVDAAYEEDPRRTLETLLYLRDIRKGQGEKRTFRTAIRHLCDRYREDFNHIGDLFDAIVELGSWKDVIDIFNVDEYYKYIESHWNDNNNLMFKWLPSIGGSSNNEAEYLAKKLGLTPRQYRKHLSKKRAELNLVETAMCQNYWDKIEYSKVPSKANVIYRDAFRKHDKDRYCKFINEARKADGTVKINTGTLYPYDIVNNYLDAWSVKSTIDPTLEALWNNLPDYCGGSNSIVVADTSGSMMGMPIAIAASLAIYFAERNIGIFHNEFITFSARPKFIQFKDGDTLQHRVNKTVSLSIVENTNIQATFDLVLKAAVDNHIPEKEMPASIIVISDMEFDDAQCNSYWTMSSKPKTNFEAIKEKYAEAGYKMPKLIFWNVDSRNDNLPVRQDESGVVLVSGSSASTFNMVVTGDTNPYNFMLSVIDQPRYKDFVDKILK